jgi:hypothetical protein
MTTALKSALIVLSITAGPLHAAYVCAQAQSPSIDDLLRSLSNADQNVREDAVNYIEKNVPPLQRTHELDAALANELDRLNRITQRRRETVRAGGRLDSDFPGEYYGSVIQVVSESLDPVVMPSLVGALGTGAMVERGLMKFGESAVVPVVAVARSKTGPIIGGAPGDIPPHVVAGALRTLRELTVNSVQSVTAKSRDAITAVAHERLVGRQDPAVVIAACQLAISTGNADLRARVSQLALNRDELIGMGIADSRWIERVQLSAQQLLGAK